MAQPFADALSWVPKSRHLAATLARAHDFARGLAHPTVTLEHLLLALVEDPDASIVLQACDIDLARLRAAADGYLAGQPRGEQQVVLEAHRDLVRILDYAVAAAQQSRRREVNGAIVLAAIVGEGKSQAAALLQENGLTFAEAIRALQTASAGPPRSQLAAASAAATEATEQILASTRRRLDSGRTATAAPPGSAPGAVGGAASQSPVNGMAAQPGAARGSQPPP
ncbi:MAG TPA: Clp protease N-terminal domain-containing protein, partial [Hyphomicrobiaceae bacterium]|nr:Clp protease N-terminal domain-containing protein [Hyphomicrobiaceae bacterium]